MTLDVFILIFFLIKMKNLIIIYKSNFKEKGYSMSSYEIIETIHEGISTYIHKAKCIEDGKKVIIKALKTEYPSEEDVAKLKYEYDMAKEINLTGVATYKEFTRHKNIPIIVMEDFGGESLKNILEKQKIDLKTFLEIGVTLSESLAGIHKLNIIHKDIKTHNIIMNTETEEVKIIDFGISNYVANEKQNTGSEQALRGTLAYISPEQTGRMNQKIDHRTDLYSLGITLYEIITGKLPFESNDPMELVHSHIAVNPVPPHEVDPHIPKVVSEIIMKLLMKNVDDRYQSAYGLKYDLETCLEKYQNNGMIENFQICQKDIPDTLQIPQKIYGREQELEDIMKVFEKISKDERSLLAIRGHSGVGKTALVEEFQRRTVASSKEGSKLKFISGIYDQFRQNIPYHGIIEAFDKLIKRILTQKKSKIKEWKKKIIEAVSPNGQVLTEVIPSLELIIDKQPDVVQLDPEKSQNRFNMVFQNFIKVFTSETPMILFLDDLQYIDISSTKLLESIIRDNENTNLLIIGAFCDNEIKEDHQLMKVIDKLEKDEIPVTNISLQPIKEKGVSKLIADTLFRDEDEVSELSNAIKSKTNNNPFFIQHFLNTLYKEKFIEFSFDEGKWVWYIDKIRNMSITDNVAELMTDQIQQLPEDTQEIIKLAASNGIQFNINTLSAVSRKSIKEVADSLQKAVDEGMIFPLGEDYKYITEDTSIEDDIKAEYKFLHERVQSACYSLIEEEQRKQNHLQIGKYMYSVTPDEEMESHIFEILNQLNASRELLTNQEELETLIRLNLKGSRKAIESTAFEIAREYISVGMEVMPDDFWEKAYDLAFRLFFNRSRIEYSLENNEETEKYLRISLDKAQTDTHKLQVYDMLVVLYTKKGEADEAVRIGKEGLKIFDISIPEEKEKVQAMQNEEFQKLKKNLSEKTPDDIYNLPMVEDEKYQVLSEIISHMFGVAHMAMKAEIGYVLIFRLINILIDKGNTEMIPFSMIFYCNFLRNEKDKVDEAYEWGLMATKLADKMNNPVIIPGVYNAFAMFIHPLKNPVKTSYPLYDKAYKAAMAVGNWFVAGSILANASHLRFTNGEYLTKALEYVNNSITYARKLHNNTLELSLLPMKRANLALQGETEDGASFNSKKSDEDIFNEKDFYDNIIEMKHGVAIDWYFDSKLITLAVFGEYKGIIDIIKKMKELNMKFESRNKLFYFIALIQLYDELPDDTKEERDKFIEDLANDANNAIDNSKEDGSLFIPYLVLAEYSKHKGDYKKAIPSYDKAIMYAEQSSSIVFYNGIACELASKFYLSLESELSAKAHMTEAFYVYKHWGALGKVKALEKEFSHLITERGDSSDAKISTDATISVSSSSDSSSVMLDLSTVMKASSTISGEMVLDKLLKKLMKIVLENAGAQKGFLILNDDGELKIEAEGNIDQSDVKITDSVPVWDSGLVAESIINYVERTHEDVVLKNASQDQTYNSDPYIRDHKPKSILSIALLNQGKMIGILYLENNITIGAFTPERLEVLKMLSSQIAVSIENATLYTKLEDYNRNLEKKVEQRTSELHKANKELVRAFEEVNTLKVQQDGDYFLTSLLIKPLISNRVQSDTVKTEFYISQKKKFKFRKWNAELGGDICISDSVILREHDKDKEYSVFVNGDAMGKSIQGAGGALVLGVVFNAFVTRTKYVPGASDLSPEEWLIRCFRELQDVFVSFDGSMLISVVMGIIDDESGMMYFFNAEHPWTVLYRKEKAEFIEDELQNRKIGTMLGMEKIQIQTQQLKAGDIVIAGSDGRDDIVLKEDEETGERVFNYDDTLFLRNVEKGKGDLNAVAEEIKNIGEVSDDLSLLKIAYKAGEKYENENSIPNDFDVLKEEGVKAYQQKNYTQAIYHLEQALLRYKDRECYSKLIYSYIKTGDYTMALNTSEKAIRWYPGDLGIIFQSSVLNKKHKNFNKAIYYGKRYYIHKPKDTKNLINLSNAYQLIKNYKEAKKLINEALEIEPENEQIIRLKNIIEKESKKK